MMSVRDLTCARSQVNLPPRLSPSCVRHYISQHLYRYDLYKMKVLPSPIARSPPAVPLVSPSTARKGKSPTVKAALGAKAQRAAVSKAPRYAKVQFKLESGHFMAPFRVAVGDCVVVEGDRGTHMGTVAALTTDPPRQEAVRRVLRRATASDLDAFHLQKEHEVEAVSVATAIAQECRMNKEARIVDAEFQFDGQKLTIFVERSSASVFVDFRKLQRGLYKEYHCRIWCAYVDELSRGD